MNSGQISSRNKTIMLIIALVFMVVNTLITLLFLNTEFVSITDKMLINTKIIIILNGVCFGCFFLALKFIDVLSTQKIFLIFLITRIAFLCFFVVFNYGVERDFYDMFITTGNVLDGQLFTPYYPISNWISDVWRILPPLWMWWYTYNYWIYGLNEIIWRFINLILEVGIVYVMIQIFHENSSTEKGWTEGNFKIGLSFYTFSILPIASILLYANIIAFPVLLGIIGFLFFFRSKKDPKYLYHSVFFFCLATLTEYFAAVWIFTILIIILFQKDFKRFFILVGEIIGVFCIVTLPFLINDAIGFFTRMIWHFRGYSISFDGTIWVINTDLLNWPDIINIIPAFIAVVLSINYLYKNSTSRVSLEAFIVIICIFEFFAPGFSPWHYLWIFPLICINLIYSFRRFIITNLFFILYFVGMIIAFAVAFITYPGPFFPADPSLTFTNITENFMRPLGYYVLLRSFGQLLFQTGFILLIYYYSKSKRLVLLLLIPFTVYYLFNICVPINFIA